MFIAVENMASAYGDKSANTDNKPIVRPQGKQSKKEQQRQQDSKQPVYEARKKLAKNLNYEIEDRAAGNIFSIVQRFVSKNQNLCRYGIAGSLPSMLKRLAFESANMNCKFDTLVFVGHGNTGIMTVGLGSGPDLLREEHSERLSDKQQAIVDDMKLENRKITIQNQDTWVAEFDKVKQSFTADKDGIFHVMFAGCCTGNLSEKSYRFITHKVAKKLAGLLNCTVNAYGMRESINNAHVMETLEDIDKIKGSAPANPGGPEGTYILELRASGGEKVEVASWKH